MQVRTTLLPCSILLLALAGTAPRSAAQGGGPGPFPDCNNNGIDDSVDVAPGGGSSDCNANGIPDECEADCNANGIADECDISSTTSSDCNGNGVPDECDLANGTSEDCNGNGLSDSCDIKAGTSFDCNANGVPDDCDLESGMSADCNRNSRPDECDLAGYPALDCDGNGAIDSCDVRSGAVPDCNSNGVPDSCEPDCNANGIPDDCDLTSGTSTDLNDDGVLDECPAGWDCNDNKVSDVLDVINGTSLDCNGDFYPDECQSSSDCNGNSISDWCDVAAGTSPDSDGNQVPDECQTVRNVPSGTYPTIQSAVNAANSGDLILLASGTYSGPGNRDIDFGGKVLTIRGATGAANVIIDPLGAGRGFYLHSNESRNSSIEQLTIRNGAAPSGQHGGAMYLFNSSPTVRDCVLETSTAQSGGAVFLSGGGPRFQDCAFYDNVASTSGGALASSLAGWQFDTPFNSALFEGCTFHGNSSNVGGAVSISHGRNRLVACEFISNHAGFGGALSIQGVSVAIGYACEVIDCSMIANSASGTGGAVNVNLSQPRFVGCTMDQNVGGAMRTFLSDPWIERCTIRSNVGASGRAALDFDSSVPVIRNTIVAANSLGGGIRLRNQGEQSFRRVLITGCTIAYNQTDGWGGGLRIDHNSAVQLYDCIVWGNAAVVDGNQVARFSPGELRVRYTDFDSLVTGMVNPIYTTLPLAAGSFGPGNINVDPQFVNTGLGDYHLKRTSRCINRGDPAFVPMAGEVDIDGQPRLLYTAVDMGADEYQF